MGQNEQLHHMFHFTVKMCEMIERSEMSNCDLSRFFTPAGTLSSENLRKGYVEFGSYFGQFEHGSIEARFGMQTIEVAQFGMQTNEVAAEIQELKVEFLAHQQAQMLTEPQQMVAEATP